MIILSWILNVMGMAHTYLSCPSIASRAEWNARPPKGETKLSIPVPYVVIHHTYIPAVCNTTAECMSSMRGMQKFHQDDNGWDDIGYNFCIGGDGEIYEGRGWDLVGAHTIGYNYNGIGICFIGDYTQNIPSDAMLEAGKKLIWCGVHKGKIQSNYTLLGHRQAGNTECPGEAFYKEIQKWPHWSSDP